MSEPVDVVVVGAGFGGLGAALGLAERGVRVVLCEALTYPGGCASTFRKEGHRFEAGATLFSGLDDHQLFGRWRRTHGLDVTFERLDPVVELRTAEGILPVDADREAFVDRLARASGDRGPAVRRFFADQRRVADTLWALFDDPELLPPLSAATVARHLARAPRYLPLLGLVGRPLAAVLGRYGLADLRPFRTWVDAVCQITVQAGAAEAEAPFALAAMDYFWRGTGHVRGGIGELAAGLADAVTRAGGEVRFAERGRALHRDGDRWVLQTRTGEVHARHVVANLLPQALAGLLGRDAPGLDSRAREVAEGWGAVMAYLVLRPPDGAGDDARHLELVDDPEAPLAEGNHLFVSISGAHDPGRAPAGMRTATVSTHLPIAALRGQPAEVQAERVAAVQARMRDTLARRAPEWAAGVVRAWPGSPRTFQRFTRRPEGLVGGVPRRVGWTHYLSIGPTEVERGLWMVGDSVFPGQSTYATAVGGVRVAEAVARRLSASQGPKTSG